VVIATVEGSMRRFCRQLPLVLLVSLAAAPAAQADIEVGFSSGRLEITGDAFRNDVVVTRTGGRYLVTQDSTNRAFTANAPCFETQGRVECQSANEVVVRVEGRAGDDEARMVGTTRPTALIGENGDDRLFGGDGPDDMFGGDGQDVLEGRDGDDAINGGTNPDAIRGGVGQDTVSYSDRFGPVEVDLGDPNAAGPDGGGGGSADGTLLAPARRDTYDDIERAVGTPFDDVLLGNSRTNVLDGRAGDDIVAGRAAGDVLDGGVGADTLQGDEGLDRVSYGDRDEPVVVALDNVANDGGPPDRGGDDIRDDVESVIGTRFGDRLTGGPGSERLEGGGGGDRLVGGPQRDVLVGGDGLDTVSYADRNEGVVAALSTAAGNGSAADGEGDLIASSVEALEGSLGPDVLQGDDGPNFLAGGFAPDTLLGGGGDDVLDGGLRGDVLDGQAGGDTTIYADVRPQQGRFEGVRVRLDDQRNDGGEGDFIAFGDDPSGDLVLTESVIGTQFSDELIGNGVFNRFEGRGGDDVLRGGGGGDSLDGEAGADEVFGDDGEDTLSANDGELDRLSCGADVDSADLDLLDVAAELPRSARDATPADCEQVARAPRGELPAVAIAARVLRVDAAGRARLALRCPRAVKTRAGCRGRLVALDGDRRAGRARFRLRRGERGTVRLRVDGVALGAELLLETRERARDGRPRTARVLVRVARRR
jgi:Ca2+-binding RTX toxin-like protein